MFYVSSVSAPFFTYTRRTTLDFVSNSELNLCTVPWPAVVRLLPQLLGNKPNVFL